MDIINAVGKPCPLPVIEAKKAIAKLGDTTGEVHVLVDNTISQINLEKMAAGKGYAFSSQTQPDGNILVSIAVEATCETVLQDDSGLVVAIGQDFMGQGSEELGKMLMKSFIFSLTELDTPPEHLLFFNGGVRLTTDGSAVLQDLQTLAEKGTTIDSCGACLNYYHLAEKLQIGSVTNMFAIVSAMAQAKKVLRI